MARWKDRTIGPTITGDRIFSPRVGEGREDLRRHAHGYRKPLNGERRIERQPMTERRHALLPHAPGGPALLKGRRRVR